jgi:hypothetical protein
MKCQCEQCSTTPGPTWTAAHRLSCLARHAAGLGYKARADFFAKQSLESLRALYREKDLAAFRNEIERVAQAKK